MFAQLSILLPGHQLAEQNYAIAQANLAGAEARLTASWGRVYR
jgi:hypothetical protein